LGGFLLPLFSRANFTSVLSLCLAGAVLLYSVPVPLAAQLPKIPKPPEMPAVKPPVEPPAAAPPAAGQDAAPAPVASSGQMPLPDDQPPFHITVIEGEGAVNNIHQQVNRAATVIVEDENKTPLSGVAVTFFLPNDGPSGLFPNGSRVLTVFTDDKGIAQSRPIHFNPLVGIMPIRVSASLFAQNVNATITQTNVGTGQAIRSYVSPITRNQEPHSGFHVSKKVWVGALVVGAGVAAGVILLNRSSPPNAAIGGTTTTGPITLGGPK
jgi:hypothetical protein